MRPRLTIATITSLISMLVFVGNVLTGGEGKPASQLDRTPVWATLTMQAAQAALAATPTVAPAHVSAQAAYSAISLEVPAAPANAWTIVQWQDSQGGWHNVTGWEGNFDEGNRKIWVVFEKDFHTGPFRWVVLYEKNGALWGISEPFNLPGYNTLLQIAVAKWKK